MQQPSAISFSDRCKILALLWGAAFLGMFLFAMPLAVMFWMFPVGLLRLFAVPVPHLFNGMVCAAWVPFCAATAAALTTRKRTVYLVLFGILLLLFVANAVGGYRMMLELD